MEESTTAGKLIGKAIPGFQNLPYELQEGGSQLALGVVGEGVGASIGYTGKKATEMVVGFANRSHNPAATAIREGINLSKRGLDKIARLTARIHPQIEQKLANSQLLANFDQDIIQSDEVARVIDDALKTKDTNAEVWVRKFIQKMYGKPENQGPITAQRLYELSKPGPGVADIYVGRAFGRSPKAGEAMAWKKRVDEAVSNASRRILQGAHPEVGDLLSRESSLLNLKDHIGRHIARPARGMVAGFGEVLGLGALGYAMPAKSEGEHWRNVLIGAMAGGVLQNPELVAKLAAAWRIGPQAATTTVDVINARD